MNSNKNAVGQLVALFVNLSAQDQAKCYELISKLAGHGNGFQLPYYPMNPMFGHHGSASPPPPALPVVLLEQQQQQQQQQQPEPISAPSATRWSDQTALEAVKNPPPDALLVKAQKDKPKNKTDQRVVPDNAESICGRENCLCFGFKHVGEKREWAPQKLVLFPVGVHYRDYNQIQLRKLAETAVGGRDQRKELVESTYACQGKKGPIIELLCHSHKHAVEAMWILWKSRAQFNMGVNWAFERRQYNEPDQEEEEEEEEN